MKYKNIKHKFYWFYMLRQQKDKIAYDTLPLNIMYTLLERESNTFFIL